MVIGNIRYGVWFYRVARRHRSYAFIIFEAKLEPGSYYILSQLSTFG